MFILKHGRENQKLQWTENLKKTRELEKEEKEEKNEKNKIWGGIINLICRYRPNDLGAFPSLSQHQQGASPEHHPKLATW